MTDPADPAAAPAKKSGRGGARLGAGRKSTKQKAPSALPDIDLAAALSAAVPDDIESVASSRAKKAIGSLVKVILHGKSEQAKVTACNKILDRGYGKPSVDAGGFAQMALFPVGVNIDVQLANEIRDEARKFANLAIDTLEAISERGQVEGARVSAAASLIDRGIGTVATAKVPEGIIPAKAVVGKKEQAAVDAKNAAQGKYASPPPPRSVSMNERVQ